MLSASPNNGTDKLDRISGHVMVSMRLYRLGIKCMSLEAVGRDSSRCGNWPLLNPNFIVEYATDVSALSHGKAVYTLSLISLSNQFSE